MKLKTGCTPSRQLWLLPWEHDIIKYRSSVPLLNLRVLAICRRCLELADVSQSVIVSKSPARLDKGSAKAGSFYLTQSARLYLTYCETGIIVI